MNLDAVSAVFEIVLLFFDFVWQFARFASDHESAVELVGDRSADDESPCLDRNDLIDGRVAVMLDERIDDALEPPGIFQQRGDVTKLNPRFGEVGDGADQLFEVILGIGIGRAVDARFHSQIIRWSDVGHFWSLSNVEYGRQECPPSRRL